MLDLFNVLVGVECGENTYACKDVIGAGIPGNIVNIIHYIYVGIQIIVPILLIIFGMIELAKAITAQKEDEIKKACELCVEAKADYVKTSTGFSTRGATIEDVRIMKEAVHGKAKVKAAGGVRTPEDMVKIVAAGADRIGTSAGCSLVKK